MDFRVAHRLHGELAIVTVAGDIDVFTSPRLREALLELIENGSVHLVVDLNDVQFLDSTGLGVLVGVFHRLRAHNGSMVFVGAKERVRHIFHITQLTKIFTLHMSLDEALDASPGNPNPAPW